MDNKTFFRYTKELKELLKQPNTFRNRRKVRKVRKEINKMIKTAAKLQANLVYTANSRPLSKYFDFKF